MEMHQVRYFLAVARTLNFTRAAEQCNVAQPSLTRAVQKLEEELGGLLLHRERQNTHLTELGRLMLPHLERTFLAAQAARDLASGIRKGQMAPLRIGASSTLSTESLMDLLGGMRSCVNGLELTLDHAPDGELVEDSMEGEHDVVFVSDSAELPERMRGWPLFRESCRLIMPAGHRLARLRIVPLSELEGEEFVERRDCADYRKLRLVCGEAGVSPRFSHKVNDTESLIRLVSHGFGLALLPANVPLSGELVARALDCAAAERGVQVAVVAGRPFSRATEACLRLARSKDWSAAPAD